MYSTWTWMLSRMVHWHWRPGRARRKAVGRTSDGVASRSLLALAGFHQQSVPLLRHWAHFLQPDWMTEKINDLYLYSPLIGLLLATHKNLLNLGNREECHGSYEYLLHLVNGQECHTGVIKTCFASLGQCARMSCGIYKDFLHLGNVQKCHMWVIQLVSLGHWATISYRSYKDFLHLEMGQEYHMGVITTCFT